MHHYHALQTIYQKSINKNVKNCKEKCKYVQRKNDLLIYKCKKCNNKSYNPIDALKEKFPNTYKFCTNDNNKFLSLLRKSVYPCEYMDDWERFNQTELPDKKEFYNKLNLEGIADEDYKYAHKVWDTFSIKDLGEYHHLYVQSDTLLLADICEMFGERCLEIYQLDPVHFLSQPGLAWQACFKKARGKLELLTDINMLLMIEEGYVEEYVK